MKVNAPNPTHYAYVGQAGLRIVGREVLASLARLDTRVVGGV